MCVHDDGLWTVPPQPPGLDMAVTLRGGERRSGNLDVGRVLCQLVRPRAELSSEQLAALPAIGEQLLAMAREHRVAGLLALGLDARGIRLDPAAQQELHADRGRNELTHLLALRELRTLCDVLEVDWVAVKGPVLSSYWYGSAGARGYSDLDLLVHPEDFVDALGSLRSLGYCELADNWRGFHRNEVAEVPLRRGENTVDLHWHLVGYGPARRDLRLATAPLLRRAVTVEIGGTAVPTLDPVDTLLHLCVHAGLAGARRLLHLADVDVVVRSGAVDWSELVGRTRAARCAALVVTVLDRAVRELGSPVPDEVCRQLAPYPLLRPAVRALGRIRDDGVTGFGVPIEGVRDGVVATGIATTGRIAAAVWGALGGTPASHDPEGINWFGPERSPSEVAASRASYLAYVAAGHEARPTRQPRRLLQLFGDEQPHTTIPLAHAASASRLGWRTRAWVVRDRGGTPVGGLVIVVQGPFHIFAYPLLVNPAAAPTVAGLIERSSARLVVGYRDHVQPLQPFLSRWRNEVETKAGAISAQDMPEIGPTASELGRPSDRDELARFLRRLMPHLLLTDGLARLFARAALARGCVVLRDNGRIIGYLTVEASTPMFSVVGTIGVHPDRRGEGLAWDMVETLAKHVGDQGRGLQAISLATNPMSLPPETVQSDPGMLVWLHHPRRVRGEPRLWRLAQRLFRRGG